MTALSSDDEEQDPVLELQQSSLSVFYSSDEAAVDLDGVGDEIDIRGDPGARVPPPLYVLELAPRVSAVTLDWYIGRVQGRRRVGGAELMVSAQPQLEGKGLVLHVTASRLKLLETAERLQLRKRDRAGQLREFSCAELDEFTVDDVDSLLSTAEKQRIVLHELEHIRAAGGAAHPLPGCSTIKLYPGQSVTRLMLQEGMIIQMFPTHDDETLHKLGQSWYAALFQRQPFEDIRGYFGESVALYFSFLGFYTTALCGPAALGILQNIFSVDTIHEYALYSLFNMLWVTVFLEAWKRKCNELAYVWGVMDKSQLSFLEPRANHHGQMVRDEITGRYLPYYPRWKTLVKVYSVSLPSVLVCLLVSFYMMLVSFWAEEYLALNKHRYGNNLSVVLIMLPSIVYSVLVLVLNKCYNHLATLLTEWENHRTQKQFDYYRVIKLALFEFVNSFMCLFYIAFYMQDMEMLRSQLAVMLIIQQVVSHFQEALLPIILRKAYCAVREKAVGLLKKHPLANKLGATSFWQRHPSDATDDDVRVHVRVLEPEDPCVQEVNRQLELDPYPDTHEDYLEMYVQFGYAFLFSSVFPMAAFWAVLNNVLEIRADAFKLCRIYQRPPAKSVRNIGAWMPAFEVLGFVAVFTNCALLCLSESVRSAAPSMTGSDWMVVFLLLEHTLLALKLLLAHLVPDVPGWVRRAVLQHEFSVRQQLHRQRRREIRQRLSRRFPSKVNPTRTISQEPGVRMRHH